MKNYSSTNTTNALDQAVTSVIENGLQDKQTKLQQD